jgi:hypothetical protein
MGCSGRFGIESGPDLHWAFRFRRSGVGVLMRVGVVAGSVGAVDFYEFVVDAEDEEGCGPLSDEESLMLFFSGLKA